MPCSESLKKAAALPVVSPLSLSLLEAAEREERHHSEGHGHLQRVRSSSSSREQ